MSRDPNEPLGDGETLEEYIHTLVITYTSTEANAETFTVVMGSVAENFRFVEIHEIVDEAIFADGGDDRGAVDALYAALTADGRLDRDKRDQIERFAEELRSWEGDMD